MKEEGREMVDKKEIAECLNELLSYPRKPSPMLSIGCLKPFDIRKKHEAPHI